MLFSLLLTIACQESDIIATLNELVRAKPAFLVAGDLSAAETGKPKVEKGPDDYFDKEGNKIASFHLSARYSSIQLNWEKTLAKTSFAENDGETLLIADGNSVTSKHFSYPVTSSWMGNSILLTSAKDLHHCSILKLDGKSREWRETPIDVEELSQAWADSEETFWAIEKKSSMLIHMGKDGTIDLRHSFSGDHNSIPASGFSFLFSSHMATDVIVYDADANEEKTILESLKVKDATDYHYQWVPDSAVLAVLYRDIGGRQVLKTYKPETGVWAEFTLNVAAFGDMVPITNDEVVVRASPKDVLSFDTYLYKINVKTGVAKPLAAKSPLGWLRMLYPCSSNVAHAESGVFSSAYPTGNTPSLVEAMKQVLSLKPDFVMRTFSPAASKAGDFDWPTSYTYYSAAGQRLSTIELPKKCGGIHLSPDKKTAVSWIYADGRTYVTIVKDNGDDSYKELSGGTSLEWFGNRLLATTRGLSVIEQDGANIEWLLRSISKYEFSSYCLDSAGGIWGCPNATLGGNRYPLIHINKLGVVDTTLETSQSLVPVLAVDGESRYVFLSNHNNLVVMDTRTKSETTLVEPTKDSILSQVVKFVWMPKLEALALFQNGDLSLYYPGTKQRVPIRIVGGYGIGSFIPLNDTELLVAARPQDSGKIQLYRLNLTNGEMTPFDKDGPTGLSVHLERVSAL
ncbi:MAG: hypothetical protein GC165_03815 [Armatimonadetes bacterium]|nr:hypothetical protein [Armatimonadota bacterium]